MSPPIDEAERLRVLAEYGVMDSPEEPELDELVQLASAICGTPIGLISLVDETRQWFKAKVGLQAKETPRDVAFCAHAIVNGTPGVFTVPDARLDPRFSQNPLVLGDPNVVFYAGAPLIAEGGASLGTLCVIDREPRTLTPLQESTLLSLSKVVVRHLELARTLAERRVLLDARVQAERELSRIFDLSHDLLGWSTPEGRFLRVNPAFERTLGWTAEELYARPINDFVHADDVIATSHERRAVVAGQGGRRFENRVRKKDGTYVYISWSAVHEHGINFFVARDVTSDRAAEFARTTLLEDARLAKDAAEKASRAMDEFLATVSHELRTPLNAMLGWTRLLRSDTVPESARPKALETIERNATVQAQLIEDLLDISRIISGKMRLEVAPVDLVAVVESALEVVRPAADAKGVILRPVLDSSASHVTGDAARLQQVVWNLLANAVKFTPKGGRVDIRLVRIDSSVELTVRDTGVGIPVDFLPHVFERFRQADGASTRSHGGLGLGLAIVKNIVELHGGTASVESAGKGEGASFFVRLPLSLLRHTGTTPVPSEPPAGPFSFERPPELIALRVLVVDDEDDARELLVAVLEQCGAIVTSVGSVREALAALAVEPRPTIVVSDIGMPGEDGYALIKQIRKLPPDQGGRLPVVALTAYARTEDRTRALRAGFNMHMPKPVEPAELLAVLVSLVQRISEV